MNTIYSFKKIIECYTNYDIQVQVYRIKESINYISIILIDCNKDKIELIAFQKSVSDLKKYKLELNKYYILKNVETMPNKLYKRTNHKFKLKFKSNLTQVKLIKTFKIIKNNQIHVEEIKKKNNE